MKKLPNPFAALAAVIAVTLVVYIGIYKVNWDKQPDDASPEASGTESSKREIFSYVPADTLFFFGGLSTVSFQEAASIMTTGNDWMIQADWSKQPGDDKKKAIPPAALMFSGVTSNYLQLLREPETAGSKMGLGKRIDVVSYSVGFIPVMRFAISDPTAFDAFIESVEKQAGVDARKTKVGDINLRSYSMDVPGSKEKTDVDLVIGSNARYAIFTLATKLEDPETRELILGTKKPHNSIDAYAVLNPIKQKYSFHPAYIGYLNHAEIMNGITGEANNQFGAMLDSLFSMARQANPATQNAAENNEPAPASENNPLEAVRTVACRKELGNLVKSWPQTVFGYTRLDFASKPANINASVIVEGTDAEFMKAMQNIRGYIPAMLQQTRSRPVFGLGFGLNIDALSPFIARASQDFISKEYQCDFLAQIKQSLIQSNPAMALGMMSGMVAGVQGVSVTILDIDGKLDVSQPQAMPQINRLDAIITISSSNPQQLLMMAANMQPGMPPLQLPADGTPVDLPVPLPVPALANAKLALKGNHIVAYVGEKATQMADQLAAEPIEPSGLFAFNMDFGKYMSLIASTAKDAKTSTGTSQEGSLTDREKAMLESMANTNMQLVELLDIKKEGIAFDIKMQAE